MNFLERNVGKLATGVFLATSTLIGANLYKTHQLEKYTPDIIETSTKVFRKNVLIYNETEKHVEEMNPKEKYETWKHVNDSLDFEQANALSQKIYDYDLRYKISEELKNANAQQAVNRWKQVVDSVRKVK